MKTFAIVVATLMIGYLLGSLAPNAKLEKARDEISSLKDSLKDSARKRKNPISGVGALLDVSENESSGTSAHVHAKQHVPDPLTVDEGGGTTTVVIGNAGVSAAGDDEAEPAKNSLSNELEFAASAWGVRSELACNAFIENTELDEGQSIRFEVLVDSMNIRLEETVYAWVDKIKADDFKISTDEELGIRMMKDFADILVITYDEMDRNMPAGWRDAAGDTFELTSLIDPDVIKPLIEVEGKLDL